jgi:uncharacterized membrane protein (DUF2068 family)
MIKTSDEQNKNVEPTAVAADDSSPVAGESEHRARGLLAIGVFKLSKALFFLSVGAGALHLVHKNLGDEFLRIATLLRLDPEGRVFGALQDRADLISGHQLRQISLATFGYAALSTVEGIGLMLEKTWAEYLTLTLTIGALPPDLYEVIRNPNSIRIGLLVINVAVLAYLLWFLRWHRAQKRERANRT